MRFTLKMDCGNAAFNEPAHEIARLLEVAAAKIREGYTESSLRDINGNTVGEFKIIGKYKV